jgi:SHS2 domain-containing protein
VNNPFPPGVRPLDHTADIGMTVQAASLPALFQAAAGGLMAFLQQDDAAAVRVPVPVSAPGESVSLDLNAEDPALLLVAWLRELLFLVEARGRCYRQARFSRLQETSLRATVEVGPCAGLLREIKGVTYHGLEVASDAQGWHARVIFDV